MSNVELLNKYIFTHFKEPTGMTNGNDKQKRWVDKSQLNIMYCNVLLPIYLPR